MKGERECSSLYIPDGVDDVAAPIVVVDDAVVADGTVVVPAEHW